MQPTHLREETSTRWASRVKLQNKKGLHVRAAGRFVVLAKTFESEIRVKCGGKDEDGKNMLALMKLEAPEGATLEVVAVGSDAFVAATELEELVKNKFGEPE